MTLFQKLAIAQCARKRAECYVLTEGRFLNEMNTAKLWMRHDVVTTEDGFPNYWF